MPRRRSSSTTSSSSSSSSSGSEPNSRQKILTFYPTETEFADFPQYIRYMEAKGAARAGIAKVIPPVSWVPNKSAKANDYKDVLNTFIKTPIEQKVIATARSAYTMVNEICKPMVVNELEELAKTQKYSAPANATTLDELESKYWRQIIFNPPIYGADTPGTLFDSSQKHWNLSKLNTIIDTVKLGPDKIDNIPGVTSSYLYFGMWRSSFCWHREDCNLYSINYLHHGCSKQWYCIPPKYHIKFLEALKKLYPDQAKKCNGFAHHKILLVKPRMVEELGIPVKKIVQDSGEFIVVFPNSFHQGFSYGFNIGEAINFATERWIPHGIDWVKDTRYLCDCRPDETVTIDIESMCKKLGIDYDLMRTQEPDYDNCPNTPTFSQRDTDWRERLKIEIDDDEDDSSSSSSMSDGSTTSDTSSGSMEKAVTPVKVKASKGQRGRPSGSVKKTKQTSMKDIIEYHVKLGAIAPYCEICHALAKSHEATETKGKKNVLNPDWLSKAEEGGKNLAKTKVLVNNDAFYPVRNQPDEPEVDRKSSLVTCKECKVRVHAFCYIGHEVGKKGETEFHCDTCRKNKGVVSVCMLCQEPGGALKSVKDSEAENSCVHLVCVLAHPEISFSKPLTRMGLDKRTLSIIKRNSACMYKQPTDVPLTSTIKCSWIRCQTRFNIRRALAAGHTAVFRDGTLDFTCLEHEKIEKNTSKKHWTPYAEELPIGYIVLAIHPDKRIHHATIVAKKMWPRLVVLFDDGSWSETTPVSDLVSIKNKPLPSDFDLDNPKTFEQSKKILDTLKESPKCQVEILWDAGETYSAKCFDVIWDEIFYVRYHTPKFKQHFNEYKATDEGDIWLKPSQFWATVDEIPTEFLNKFTFATV